MRNDRTSSDPRSTIQRGNPSTLRKLRRDLRVLFRPDSEFNPNPPNPRTRSPKNIRQFPDSIRTFGFTNPILIDRDVYIITGYERLQAAKPLGIEPVRIICLAD